MFKYPLKDKRVMQESGAQLPFTRDEFLNAGGSAFKSLFEVGKETNCAESARIKLCDKMFVFARAVNPTGSFLDANNLSGCEFGFNVVFTGSPGGLVVAAHRDLGHHGNKEHFQFMNDNRKFTLKEELINNLTTGSTPLMNETYNELGSKWPEYKKQGYQFTE